MQNQREYTMPAEWQPHERTFIEWPVAASLIRPENHERVCAAYGGVARAVAAFEPVTVIVNGDTGEEAAKYCETGSEFKVEYLVIPHNDAWCRDNGPTFLRGREGGLAAVDWRFNAWGEKYAPFDLDDQVALRLLKHLNIPCFHSPLVLEGGSIHVDGEGTLLTTRECLLNKNRNPRLSQKQIGEELMACLGVTKIIWLGRGLFGDETDGHVDNIACFAKPGTVLLQACRDPEDPNFAITRENLEILQREKDASGRELEIIELPQPPARFYKGGRLTLSYINFYFVNGGLILPVFGGEAKEADEQAARILGKLFPHRKILPIDGMGLIAEGGNVHCVTQQMPLGNPKAFPSRGRCHRR